MLHMAEMEAAAEDTLLVILSDLQLDKPLVSKAKALHLLLMLPAIHVISSHPFSPLPPSLLMQVLEKFRDILAGFEANGVDPLYVLIGSFVSQPLSRSLGGRETIEAAFTALGDAIALFPRQASNAKFLFVPGTLQIDALRPDSFHHRNNNHSTLAMQIRSHGRRLIGRPSPPPDPTAADEGVEGAGETRHLREQSV